MTKAGRPIQNNLVLVIRYRSGKIIPVVENNGLGEFLLFDNQFQMLDNLKLTPL